MSTFVFYNRFKRIEFDKKEYRFNVLNVNGVDDTIYGSRSHHSPIPQNSKVYDDPQLNISSLRGLRIDKKSVCLTHVEIPIIDFKRSEIHDNCVYFCGIARNDDNYLQLIIYEELPFIFKDDDITTTIKTKKRLSFVVNLPSYTGNVYYFNTNEFVFVSYNTTFKMINVSKKIKIASWRFEQNQKKRLHSDDNSLTEDAFNKSIKMITDMKDDLKFHQRLHIYISKDPRYIRFIADNNQDSNNNNNNNKE